MYFDRNADRTFWNKKGKTKLPEKFAGKTEEELLEIYEQAKKEMLKIAEDPGKDLKDLRAFLGKNYEALDLGNYLKRK